MIIKKFQGKTETEAILAARDEMGNNAVVMNIKKITPKGLSRFFKKELFEITAALEERDSQVTNHEYKEEKLDLTANEEMSYYLKKEEPSAIEEKLDTLHSLLEMQLKNEKQVNNSKKEMDLEENETMQYLKMVYGQLIQSEVEESFANQIIAEVEKSLKKESSLDMILAAVYQKIILKLGQAEPMNFENKKKKLVFFVGPTGVGKTTTIAKIASDIKLENKAQVALVTADTYRIAAVEQLRVYANILDIPLSVIYTNNELSQGIRELDNKDVILVDTAGRSHKNAKQFEEMLQLIQEVEIDEALFEKEIFLVISATTKYKDLAGICKTYEKLGKIKIIFTKIDETIDLGNILNIAMLTGNPLSYATFGQNVPDDIKVIDVQGIAKHLLGGSI